MHYELLKISSMIITLPLLETSVLAISSWKYGSFMSTPAGMYSSLSSPSSIAAYECDISINKLIMYMSEIVFFKSYVKIVNICCSVCT